MSAAATIEPPREPSVLSLEALPAGERLLEDSRRRRVQTLSRREWLAEGAMAAGFLAAAVAIAVLVPSGRVADWQTVMMLTLVMTLSSRIRFEVGSCYTMPSQLVFVPMLLLLPPAIVPFLVALSFSIDKAIDVIRGQVTPGRVVTAPADSWFTIGPVLVVGLAAAGEPSLDQWPVYVAALAAQFGGEAITAGVREWLHGGASGRDQLIESLWIYLVDALLSPIGLLVAIVAASQAHAVLLVVPLVLLFGIFARERSDHVDAMLTLRDAYRGTAHVLGDVVEHDDAYTGEHTRGVTELALAVAEELDLDERGKRNVEFGAILHDVGKIAIPKEIINKRGPLDDAEWELIKTHTVEAQSMLDRIGGVMAGVGRIVRSAHERYDGRGYPDGLEGDQIPIEARIIFACDAFNAITTDRPYRQGRSTALAIAEMRDNAGSQFDPSVVDALIGIVERVPGTDERQTATEVDRAGSEPAPAEPLVPEPALYGVAMTSIGEDTGHGSSSATTARRWPAQRERQRELQRKMNAQRGELALTAPPQARWGE